MAARGGSKGQYGVALSPRGNAHLVGCVTACELGFQPERVWSPSPSRMHRTEPYALPHAIMIAARATEETGAKFSPPPYAVVFEGAGRMALVAVGAARGWHVWNFAEFRASGAEVTVTLDLEGHTKPKCACPHITLDVVHGQAGETRHELLARGLKRLYPAAYRAPGRPKPAWWRRPIYCGWGDQEAVALMLEGAGRSRHALAYCTQGLYERWTKRLDAMGVPVGTIIIDAGWSAGGVWHPDPVRWPDLRGFIERRHAEGKRVLLWIATWMHEGLPEDWCVRFGKTRLTADPTHPAYRRFLRRQVRTLLSPDQGCFNADGFKIDQLAYVPTERSPRGGEHFGRSFTIEGHHAKGRCFGGTWGVELLYGLQRDIYRAAKAAKPDCLITSSTVHPYFHDTFDMVRLHDTVNVDCDVFAAMKARAQLAGAALPHHLIDADDWVHSFYQTWLTYTLESWRLGVPCILYAENFVCSWQQAPFTEPIPASDLKKIAACWKKRL